MNIGGVARQVRLLHEGLPADRFDTHLFSGQVSASEGTLEVTGGRHYDVPSLRRRPDPISDGRSYSFLMRRFAGLRPDVVHTHMAKAGSLGRIAARRSKVPVIVHTFHGHVLSGYFPGIVNKAFVAAERFLARRTDALIAVSDQIRDDLLSLGIGTPSQWHVIPYRVDLADLLNSTKSRDEARALLGLPKEGPVVGISGRLVPIKDHETFLAAARKVADARPDTTFVIAGDGELRERLERDAASLNGKVRFTGWVTDITALYGALDVVVLTSRNEGAPFALIEAGAAARPAVATKVGGVPQVVRDGETGLLAEAGDADGIAQRILDLLDDPELATKYGLAAREWVGKEFSSENLTAEIADLYEKLLADKGKGSR